MVVVAVVAAVLSASSRSWHAERAHARKAEVAEETREAGRMRACALYPCCCFCSGFRRLVIIRVRLTMCRLTVDEATRYL